MSLIEMNETSGVATILLNRPDKLNAFVGTMREELLDALTRAASESTVRVVVITGAGRAFCSGGDVAYMQGLQKAGDEDPFRELLEAGRRIVTSIRAMPKPVIAQVNGVAAGAGCNLALACDYRIASDTAQLGETFVKIGLHPDWGGSYLLPRLVGPSRALEIMMTGRMVPATEAVAIGMVDRIVPADQLPAETAMLATSIAAGPPIAISGVKRSLYASELNLLESHLDLETHIQLEAFRSADSAEGMQAFFEKRSPVFTGR